MKRYAFASLLLLFGIANAQSRHDVRTVKFSFFEVSPYLSMNRSLPMLSWVYAPKSSTFDAAIFNTTVGQAVEFKIDDRSLEITSNYNANTRVHSVALPVQCGWKRMTYQVPGMAEPKLVHSLPCESGDFLDAVFISDTQLSYDRSGIIANQIEKLDPQLILHGGDQVEIGSSHREWLDYFTAMNPIYSSTLTAFTVGNHEYEGDRGARYFEEYLHYPASEGYYQFRAGPVQVIVINTNFFWDPSLLDREKEFLERTLSRHEAKAPWTTVMFHHAAFSVGLANWKDVKGIKIPEYDRDQYHQDAEFLTVQNEIVPILEKYQVPLVLAGHTHIYERRHRNGITYLTSGPAGGRFWSRAPTWFPVIPFPAAELVDPEEEKRVDIDLPGERTYTRLFALTNHIFGETYNSDGKLIDQFELQK